MEKLDTELWYSLVYHPQIDGQTEVLKRSSGNLLECMVGEN